MIDPQNVPAVTDEELLARFIVNGDYVRPDGGVKPELFMPYKWVELSVNRHREASLDETWAIGIQVAEGRGKKLIGRADIQASACHIPPLKAQSAPILGNPNHADIVGYPPDKAEQKSLATKLAASIQRGQWISVP